MSSINDLILEIIESTNQDRLEELSKHTHYHVKYYVTKNTNINVQTINNLLVVNDASIKSTLALNPALQEEHLEKLSKDNSWSVRLNVLKNKNVSQEIIEQLMNDTHNVVASLAKNKCIKMHKVS